MKVDGFDVNNGVESVLVEENRSSSVVGQVEPTCQITMVDILKCFLQREDMPLAFDLLPKSIFLPSCRCWVALGKCLSNRRAWEDVSCLLSDASRKSANQGSIKVCLYPPGELVCAWGGDVFEAWQVFITWKKEFQAFRKKDWAALGGYNCRQWYISLSQKDASPKRLQIRASGCPAGLGG